MHRSTNGGPTRTGSRLRLGKIFTDLPLARDHPRSFGVERFCEGCRKCTDACPAKAIPGGEPTAEVHNRSNIVGVRKWSVDGQKCFGYWTKVNTDCSVCIRVCPYNRDYSQRSSRWWVKLAARSPNLALRLADRQGHGKRLLPKHWWPSTSGGRSDDAADRADRADRAERLGM